MIINGFEFFEDSTPGRRSPERQFSQDGSHGTRVFQARGRCDQQRQWEGAKALLGCNVVRSETGIDGTTRRWIERTLPHGWHKFVDADINPNLVSRLYASSVPRCYPISGKVEEVDADGWPTYTHGAYFDVRYSAVPYFVMEDADQLASAGPLVTIGGDVPARPDEGYWLQTNGRFRTRHVTRRMYPASRMVKLAGAFVKYAEGLNARQPTKQAFAFNQFRATVKYWWHQVPVENGIPWAMIAQAGGRVNNVQFDVFPRGTLLYLSSEVNEYQGPLGDLLADVCHQFSFLPNYDGTRVGDPGYLGWNALPGATAFRLFRLLKISGDGNPLAADGTNAIFPYFDFSQLFRPRQGD